MGLGRLTREIWQNTEAELFFREATDAGLSSDQIIIEDKSTNTAENLNFSREILGDKGYFVKKAILVHKPYMERRVLATAGIAWPNLDCIVSSPPIPLNIYPTSEIPMELVIQIMVGDFQRIMVYPELGYQISQEIPTKVMAAYEFLINKGFEDHLL